MGGECGDVSELSVCYFIFHLHGLAFNDTVKENSMKTFKDSTEALQCLQFYVLGLNI
jgi:hypothetical protein